MVKDSDQTQNELHNPNKVYPYWPAIIGVTAGALFIAGVLMAIKGVSVMLGAIFVLLFVLLILAFSYQEVNRWPKISDESWGMLKSGGKTGEFHEVGSVGFPTALFIFSEIMFFAGAFAAYFVLRSSYAIWPPADAPHLDVFIPSIQTAVLIVSSILIEWSTASVKRGNDFGVKYGFLGATILGAVFFVVQMGYEWPHLLSSGELSPTSVLFGASFFLLTGIHGVHVLAGFLANAVVTMKAFKGHFNEKDHGFLEAAGTYWHFVHIVWLFLFAFLWQGGLGFFQ